MAAYSSASILGPMLGLGLVGYFVDKYFDSKPKFLLISIGIAFVVSNILLFKKRRFFSKNLPEKKAPLENGAEDKKTSENNL